MKFAICIVQRSQYLRSVRTFRRYKFVDSTSSPSSRLHSSANYSSSDADINSLMDWWSAINGTSSDAADRRHGLRRQPRVLQKARPHVKKAVNHHSVTDSSVKIIFQRLQCLKKILERENGDGRQLHKAGNGGDSTSSLVPIQYSV